MALLQAHLLKWKHQPERRGASCSNTIKVQRSALQDCIAETPSLKAPLDDLPGKCPWSVAEVFDRACLP